MRSRGWNGATWLCSYSSVEQWRRRVIAFHFTDEASAYQILHSGAIRQSRQFENRRGETKPAGVYASFIHPFAMDNDIERIKEKLFFKPRAKFVDAFVIMKLRGDWIALSDSELVAPMPTPTRPYEIVGVGSWRP